jgi:tryptophanyl-tRNA synthetase
MWILSAVAGMGHLSRMTQWKVPCHCLPSSNLTLLIWIQSKLSLPESATPDDEATRAKLKLGLFSYPVLQAADILVHRSVSTFFRLHVNT